MHAVFYVVTIVGRSDGGHVGWWLGEVIRLELNVLNGPSDNKIGNLLLRSNRLTEIVVNC